MSMPELASPLAGRGAVSLPQHIPLHSQRLWLRMLRRGASVCWQSQLTDLVQWELAAATVALESRPRLTEISRPV